jgi:hypothetical protein
MNVGFLPLYCVLSVYSTILSFTLNLFIFTIISAFYYSFDSSFCSSLIVESFPFFESLFSSLSSLFLLEFFLFFWLSCSIILSPFAFLCIYQKFLFYHNTNMFIFLSESPSFSPFLLLWLDSLFFLFVTPSFFSVALAARCSLLHSAFFGSVSYRVYQIKHQKNKWQIKNRFR